MGELPNLGAIIPDPSEDPGYYPDGLDQDVKTALEGCSIVLDADKASSEVIFQDEILEKLDSYDPQKIAQMIGHAVLNAHGAEKPGVQPKYGRVILALAALGGLYEPPKPQVLNIPKPRHPFGQAPTVPLAGGKTRARHTATKRF